MSISKIKEINKKGEEDLEDLLLETAGAYLKTKGWKVMVIGGMRIEQPMLNSKFQYQFVINFVGKKNEQTNKSGKK